MNDEGGVHRTQAELARALAVLGVKPSTFHSLHLGGKTDKVKKLLEKALMRCTNDYRDRGIDDLADEFNPNFEVSDLSTIHEAYQFLIKTYVDDAERRKEKNMLTLEKMKREQELRRSSLNTRGPGGGLGSNNPSRAGSRRGSDVSMKDEKVNQGPVDMKVLDAKRRKEKEAKKLQR